MRRFPSTTVLRLGAVAVLLLIGSHAQATTVIAKDFNALCNEADLIFVGTVDRVASHWADEQQRAIETEVTFTDVQALYGTSSGAVSLRFGGGEVGDVREEVAGMPVFTPGKRYVIFARNGTAISPIVGFNQGALEVADGADGPVVHSAGGLPVTRLDGQTLVREVRPGDFAKAIPLNDFLDAVRQQLAQRSKGSAQ